MASNNWRQLPVGDDMTCLRDADLTRRPLPMRTRDALTRIVRRALARPAARSEVERYIRAMAADTGSSVSIGEIVDYLACRLSQPTR